MEQKAAPKELWRPTSPESTDIYKFKDLVSCKYNLPLVGYDALWKWSITEPANFWGEVWDYTNVKAAKPYETVRFGYYIPSLRRCLYIPRIGLISDCITDIVMDLKLYSVALISRPCRFSREPPRCSHGRPFSRELCSTLPRTCSFPLVIQTRIRSPLSPRLNPNASM